MTDRHIWHAEQTPDGARVMSGFQTVCHILAADMIHPGAVAMDIAQDIAERHNAPAHRLPVGGTVTPDVGGSR